MYPLVEKKIDQPVILHQGTFKPAATLGEAVFMITGMTIGAGILGLPYAIAKVGLIPGVVLIVAIGLIMLCLNLMMSDVATWAGENLQLPGLAGKFLGAPAKIFISVILVLRSYGTLLAYVVGEGLVLAVLFGGSPLGWSIIFWSVGSLLVWGGLERVKKAEKILSLSVMTIITGIAFYLLPRGSMVHWSSIEMAHWWVPVGVILFALHALPAIGEAHALLPDQPKRFKKAVLIGSVTPLIIYLLFIVAVVGGMGSNVTEVATIGLGTTYGPIMAILANVFAVMAMSTGFMGLGTALKESFVWDFKVHRNTSIFLVVSVPLALFLLGLRSFVQILEVVGGVFISVEALVMVAVYVKARRNIAVAPPRPLAWFVVIPVVAFFITMLIISLYTLFI